MTNSVPAATGATLDLVSVPGLNQRCVGPTTVEGVVGIMSSVRVEIENRNAPASAN